MSTTTTIPFHQWWSRSTRQWWLRPWNRNPLMRGSERLEGVLLIIAVLAVLASIPVAAALGTAAYSADAASIRTEHTSRTLLGAMIVDQPKRVIGEEREARVRWQDRESTREAVVAVPRTAVEGDRVPLWVDADGAPTEAPRSPDAAAMTGVAIGVIVFIATIVSGVLAVEGTRRWCGRRNAARWEREWRLLDADREDH